MSQKYNRQIRKEMNKNYETAVRQVKLYIEAEAQRRKFFQRLKIAAKYLFKKQLDL